MDGRSRDRSRVDRDGGDNEAARDAAALGKAGISRSTGTGSPVPDRAGDADMSGSPDDATTADATDEGGDLTDAAGLSGANVGGTGTAGSGLGDPSTPAVPQRSRGSEPREGASGGGSSGGGGARSEDA